MPKSGKSYAHIPKLIAHVNHRQEKLVLKLYQSLGKFSRRHINDILIIFLQKLGFDISGRQFS